MAYTTINKSTDNFNTKLYTGTASTSGDTQAVTGVGFQPDWVWIKNRDGAYQHVLFDSVRGVNKEIRSSQTNAEVDSGTNGYLSAFNSDGFTTTRGTNTGNHVNVSGSGFVSWNWKAGTTGSGNTSGSGTYKTYSYSVNTTAGFSIVKYTGNGTAGQQIPHHLGTIPQMIIVKNLSDSAGQSWNVYHHKVDASNPQNYTIFFNSNSARSDEQVWNDYSPTSTVFQIGSARKTNYNDDNYIAYCFAEKTGYSKFGSYTGNGSADGTFVYTGFKPAFIVQKSTAISANWPLWDSTRNISNVSHKVLNVDLSDAEYTSADGVVGIDILSNGFKMRDNNATRNQSGQTYIYMAFGQTLVGSNNVPATAR